MTPVAGTRNPTAGATLTILLITTTLLILSQYTPLPWLMSDLSGLGILLKMYLIHFSHFGIFFALNNIIWFLLLSGTLQYCILKPKALINLYLVLFLTVPPIIFTFKLFLYGSFDAIPLALGFSALNYALYGMLVIFVLQTLFYSVIKTESYKLILIILLTIVAILAMLPLTTLSVIPKNYGLLRIDTVGHYLGFITGATLATILMKRDIFNERYQRGYVLGLLLVVMFSLMHFPYWG